MANKIKGIGVDIVEIGRIKKAVVKHGQHFLNRIYTSKEIQYCTHRGKYLYPELAVRFAAKEAYVKAVGTGMREVEWKEIEVLNNKLGQPYIVLKSKKTKGIHLSLSHSQGNAVAMVVIER
ncbi:MAG: holo-ACP synthase [Candidatus Saganbacteria bacterium]|nr:holo-ACP synthase [Candidatus Saganbacteria bacterium]